MSLKSLIFGAGGRLCLIPALVLMIAASAGALYAQNGRSADAQTERERLDLNAIATLSVAVLIQSYGYIGTYADLFSTGVYDAERVNQMLRETTIYLRNSRDQLKLFQSSAAGVSSGDRQYLGEVTDILDLLIAEAESLSAFTLSHNQDDLRKYEANKTRAWSRLSKLLHRN